MKHILSFSLLVSMLLPIPLRAQVNAVENVIVEKYYVSDANDATDTTGGRTLEEGSTTYRVYIDLKPGFKLKKIYGDANHTLKIGSTANFFNNIDRPAAYFGYLINKSWLDNNPTIALDSWLTLGLASKTQAGVLKTEDTDGSMLGGKKNNGGTAGIPEGLLVNANTSAGIPLTTSDGLMLNDNALSQWIDNGFQDMSGKDTTIFGSVNTGSQFISNTAYLQQNSGVMGVTEGSNKILVAQLTSKGEISFELNIEVVDVNGNSFKYVANDNTLLADEKICPSLKYPPVCGCTDPGYLEYKPSFGCNNTDSCKTRIVFGCMDTMACNFDPKANFNLLHLCCYPGHCNNRDIGSVCPQLNANAPGSASVFTIYPNPANNELTVQISSGGDQEIKYALYNSYGRKVLEKNIGTVAGTMERQINISELADGLCTIRLYINGAWSTKMFIKF